MYWWSEVDVELDNIFYLKWCPSSIFFSCFALICFGGRRRRRRRMKVNESPVTLIRICFSMCYKRHSIWQPFLFLFIDSLNMTRNVLVVNIYRMYGKKNVLSTNNVIEKQETKKRTNRKLYSLLTKNLQKEILALFFCKTIVGLLKDFWK